MQRCTYLDGTHRDLDYNDPNPEQIVSIELEGTHLAVDLLQELFLKTVNLKELVCRYMLATGFPLYLPASLEALQCYNCNIDMLPVLPEGLKSLDCAYNRLQVLPLLPEGLELLFCSKNPITSLPEKLPPGLKFLECYYCLLPSIPILPESVIVLKCNDNNIKELPPLPLGLRILHCGNVLLNRVRNDIVRLPYIPASLFEINLIGLDNLDIPEEYRHIDRDRYQMDRLRTIVNNRFNFIRAYKQELRKYLPNEIGHKVYEYL